MHMNICKYAYVYHIYEKETWKNLKSVAMHSDIVVMGGKVTGSLSKQK